MTVTELLVSQATEPLRIGLMAALVFTTYRQRAATGFLVPLALGAAFFAVLLPSLSGGAAATIGVRALTGLAVNAAWIALFVGLWTVIARLRR
jgi:multidrug efflux pump subunit AcrB